ncbi:CxxH/CxxC protein [Mechercharimyces sp. CAU 1602]|uniref:CxxH/CxxC protein n=1 Tax=Mechercharimyces sp. CAU 1602 TaxID=2973933 RepID=UPI0037CABFE4
MIQQPLYTCDEHLEPALDDIIDLLHACPELDKLEENNSHPCYTCDKIAVYICTWSERNDI